MNTLKKKILIKKAEPVLRTRKIEHGSRLISRIEDLSINDLSAKIETATISTEDLIKKKYEDAPFMLDPWLKPGTLAMLYGKAGLGKTLCGMSIAIAVTRQLNIGKWKAGVPVGGLYVEAEMAGIEIQERTKLLTENLFPEKAPLIFLTSAEMFEQHNMVVNLKYEKWRDAITDYLNNNPDIGFIVLDNIASLVPNINENSKRDWDDINQWLIKLRFAGVAVIVIHHASMKGNARGSSAKLDNIDVLIKLSKVSGHEDEDAYFEVRFEKKRSIHGKALEPFCMRIEEDPDSGLPWTTSNAQGPNRRRYIIGLIGLGIKQRDIAEKLKCTEANVTQIKKKAIKEDFFDEAGQPTQKWLKLYDAYTAEDIINEYKEP